MNAKAITTAPSPAGLPPRQLAVRVLLAVAAGAYADAALERELARSPLGGADRALATEIAYGAIRQRRLLDAWIDSHGRVTAERQPPKLRWLLHVGLYQLLFSQRVPAAAAVSTSVELARVSGLRRLAPVVNGLLRSVLRTRAAAGGEATPWSGLVLPADPAASLGLRHSLPDWLAAALLSWLPAERAEAFAVACNTPPPLDLRVNRLRVRREDLLAAFTAAGMSAAALPEAEQGVTLLERPGDLRRLPGYPEGHWCVQDRSAQAIVPLLQLESGQRVLDACAAPGGKSTQMAELMQDQGEIWAVDRSEARLRRLSANAERLGLHALRTLVADAGEPDREKPPWDRPFDRIMLDAPCSGLGTLSRHPDARWRITPAAIEELAELQLRLLTALAPLLAPQGRLVYATCTVHPRENGDVVRAFLAARPEWQLLEERQSWPGGSQLRQAAQPDPAGAVAAGGDGFYAAVLALREAAAR